MDDTIKDMILYTVIGFLSKKKLATFNKDGFEKLKDARELAKELIQRGYERVIIRRKEIYFGNENHEVSCSVLIEVIEA